MILPSRQQQARNLRIERQPGKLMAQFGELPCFIDRTEFAQQLISVRDHPGRRWLDERELAHFTQFERSQAQDHSRQGYAEYLRVGKFRALQKIRFLVQTYAHAAHNPPASSGALVGCGARDLFNMQLLDLQANAVTVHPRQAAVDHVTDIWHCQRRFRDIGRQHHPPLSPGLEHPVLFSRRQPREQWQHFNSFRVMFAQHFRSVTYLAFAGKEYQYVSPQSSCREFIERTTDRLRNILKIAFCVHVQRTIAYLHRIAAPGHLHDLGAEMSGEALGIQRGRGNDQFEIGPARQKSFEVAEQKIDVQTALMRLVNDQRVVIFQQWIAVYLREQYAVGHQLDAAVRRYLVVKPHLVADHSAQLGFQFKRDARCDRTRRDTARLCVADDARYTAPEHQADLRQLSSFSRAGLTAHDHDLVFRNHTRQILAFLHHRQIGRKFYCSKQINSRFAPRSSRRQLGISGQKRLSNG